MLSERDNHMLQAMPASVKELAEDCGYSRVWVWKVLQDLRARNLCFVLRWERTGRRFAPVYMAGCLKDRPKPPAADPGPASRANRKRKAARAKGPFAQLFI